MKPFPTNDMKVMIVTDAASKKETSAGLSIRGAIIGLGCADSRSPGGPVHVLEAYSRKQRRVIRSTLAAETQAALDAYETGKKRNANLPEPKEPEFLIFEDFYNIMQEEL